MVVVNTKKRIAVLRGGPTSAHAISLASGKNVLHTLLKNNLEPIDIYIDKSGVWHLEGVVTNPHTALQHVDFIWNTISGEYGEDGTLQKILEDIGKPKNGGDSFALGLSIDKHTTKSIAKQLGFSVPKSSLVRTSDTKSEEKLIEIWQTFHHPLIVKPNASSASVGVVVVRDFISLSKHAQDILEKGHNVLVEEYIQGREVSVAVLDDMRGKRHYTAIPLEVLHGGEYLKNSHKKNGTLHTRPMTHFSPSERERVQEMAREVHEALGLRHYSMSDFIVTKNQIYFLEINSLPHLAPHSVFVRSLEESGLHLKDFVKHIIK